MPEETLIKKEIKEVKKDISKKDNLNNLEFKSVSEEQKYKILQMSEISLLLDTYDDIFSDFDPRPYSQRALSVDLLNELKRASVEKISGQISLKFLIPTAMKSAERESVIKKRLREHFKNHEQSLHSEINTIRKQGLFLTLLGAPITLIATYLSILPPNLGTNFLVVLCEPAGWFITWTGLERVFSARRQKETDIKFYEKMSNCEISFLTY